MEQNFTMVTKLLPAPVISGTFNLAPATRMLTYTPPEILITESKTENAENTYFTLITSSGGTKIGSWYLNLSVEFEKMVAVINHYVRVYGMTFNYDNLWETNPYFARKLWKYLDQESWVNAKRYLAEKERIANENEKARKGKEKQAAIAKRFWDTFEGGKYAENENTRYFKIVDGTVQQIKKGSSSQSTSSGSNKMSDAEKRSKLTNLF